LIRTFRSGRAAFIAPRAVAITNWDKEEQGPGGHPSLSVSSGEYLAILRQEGNGWLLAYHPYDEGEANVLGLHVLGHLGFIREEAVNILDPFILQWNSNRHRIEAKYLIWAFNERGGFIGPMFDEQL
jgi:hypothetical protein